MDSADFEGVIQFLNSDDIMLVYTGMIQLQDLIFGFHSQLPYAEVNKAIVGLLWKSAQELGDFLIEINSKSSTNKANNVEIDLGL